MKTAIALLAAALSVAALSTNASAQQRMASNLGTTFPSVVTEKFKYPATGRRFHEHWQP